MFHEHSAFVRAKQSEMYSGILAGEEVHGMRPSVSETITSVMYVLKSWCGV